MRADSHGGDDLERASDEYCGQVVALYQTESKSFRTLLTGVLVFGFVFLFLVLVPLVRVHHQHRVVSDRLHAVSAAADQRVAELAALRRSAEGFDHLRQQVEQGPYALRESLPALLSAAGRPSPEELNPPVQQQMMQAPIQQQTVQPPPLAAEDDSCGSPHSRPDWADCRVARGARRQFQGYRGLLEAEVLAPLRTVSSSPAGPDLGVLEIGFDSLQAAFEARLAANPRFWERFTGKMDFFAQLSHELGDLWRQYGFESQRLALEAARARLDTLKQELETRQKALEAGEEKLTARLADLDSPFGKLPVGLVEAVQVFPLLIAIGFVSCYLLLRRLVGLRQALRGAYERRHPSLAELTERHLALVAPLWLDRGHPALSYALLFAPVGVFVAGSVLNGYHWSLDPASDELLRLDRWIYGGLYLVSAVALYYVGRTGVMLVRHLRVEVSQGVKA